MELKEFYEKVGGDYEDVLRRLPAVGMVKKFVRKFMEDPSYGRLQTALEQEDIPIAFREAHTIKGTAANLGLDTLAVAATALTEELRAATVLPEQKYVDAVVDAYDRTICAIRQIA